MFQTVYAVYEVLFLSNLLFYMQTVSLAKEEAIYQITLVLKVAVHRATLERLSNISWRMCGLCV